VRTQVVRATAGTLGTVLVLGLAVTAVGAWGEDIRTRLFNVVGDPRVGLADGVTLATDEPVVPVPVLVTTAWSPATDIAMITAGTGGPVRALDAAGLQQLDPTRFPGELGSGPLSDGSRAYATPLGIVVVPPPSTSPQDYPSVRLYGLPAGRRFATEAQQSELTRNLATAWGMGAGIERFGESLVVSTFPEGRYHSTVARIAVPGLSDPCVACAMAVATFAADGTFREAGVVTQHVTSTRPVRVVSAAAAFDDLRHYRTEGNPLEPDLGPVTSARLLLVGGDDPQLAAVIQWDFRNAAGDTVGSAYAIPSS
jgi:hypothetical protein